MCHSLREDGSGSAYDKESMAIIKLNNTTVLYLKEVTKFLALVCILREESFERKGNLSGKFCGALGSVDDKSVLPQVYESCGMKLKFKTH